MPTGYTAPVEDGTITDLADFVLTCARGWGALVRLRDSDQSLEVTRRYIESEAYLEDLDSGYYTSDLQASESRLAELLRMTDEEVLAAAQAQADDTRRRNDELEIDLAVKTARYEAMIAKVEAWQPPTPDHVEFKNFMLEQLRISIDKPWAMTLPEVDLIWRTMQVERLRARIEKDKEEIQKQWERNEARRAWITALVQSLEEPCLA